MASSNKGAPQAELGHGSVDPLSYAVTSRDEKTAEMVDSALTFGRASLAYQPVVQSSRPKHVAFYEGLIRVKDHTGRIIPARDFMGSVEDIEVGRRLDCASLEMGPKALAANPELRLSINMSARSIGYRKWLSTLDAGLVGQPTVAERLILEITESSAMTMPELVISFMKEMHARGISFALDDFGAGYTSFRYLRDFFFDILKIDGQFTRNIAKNADNQVLAQALISIANHFEMFTVAEAVETVADARVLRSMGFDCLQGYYFGAPSLTPPWEKEAVDNAKKNQPNLITINHY